MRFRVWRISDSGPGQKRISGLATRHLVHALYLSNTTIFDVVQFAKGEKRIYGATHACLGPSAQGLGRPYKQRGVINHNVQSGAP